MSKKKKSNAKRKKPPGAKKLGVPDRKKLSDNPLYKLMAAKEICVVDFDHSFEVVRVINSFLENNTFEPALNDDYSIFSSGGFDSERNLDLVIISGYKLDDMIIGIIQDFLEKHDKAQEWRVEV